MEKNYVRVKADSHNKRTRADFREQGRRVRRRRKLVNKHKRQEELQQHKYDKTIGLATHIQHISERLQGAREAHERGQREIVFFYKKHILIRGKIRRYEISMRPCVVSNIHKPQTSLSGPQVKDEGQGWRY